MISLPPLYAVIDADLCRRAGYEPLALADAFLAGGATLIQWRAKHLPAAEFLETAERLVARAGTAARVIVNDRADIAALSGAAGVHLGQEDLSVADARALVGHAAMIGLSTHSTAQVREALRPGAEGADRRPGAPVSYIAVGPVFETATKDTGYQAVGLALVTEARQAASEHGVPLVAIGGITLARAAEVLAAGADSVCVISDLVNGDPREKVARFMDLGTGQRVP